MAENRLSRPQLKAKVHKRVADEIVNDMCDFVRNSALHLWGEQHPPNYLKDSLDIMLYHDLFDIGYNEIYRQIKQWYPNSKNSLFHNCHALRLELKDWAHENLEFGDSAEWVEAARDTQPDRTPEDVNVWADSTDYQIEGRAVYGRKSDKWSYKLNAPGRRYMFFRNGLGKVIKIIGGYSPKIRDYMWIEERADWINETFEGATIIGDNDWRTGMQHLDPERVTVHAPFSLPRGRRPNDANMAVLTDAQLRYNSAVSRKRARIENYFATMESKFEALQSAWAEDEEQLDALVWYAAAVMNKMRERRNL